MSGRYEGERKGGWRNRVRERGAGGRGGREGDKVQISDLKNDVRGMYQEAFVRRSLPTEMALHALPAFSARALKQIKRHAQRPRANIALRPALRRRACRAPLVRRARTHYAHHTPHTHTHAHARTHAHTHTNTLSLSLSLSLSHTHTPQVSIVKGRRRFLLPARARQVYIQWTLKSVRMRGRPRKYQDRKFTRKKS